MKSRTGWQRIRVALLALSAVLAGLGGALAYQYRNEQARVRAAAEERLASRVRLRAHRIAVWKTEHLQDAVALAFDLAMWPGGEEVLAGRARAGAVDADRWARHHTGGRGYAGVLVVDRNLAVRLPPERVGQPLDGHTHEALAEALRGTPASTDFVAPVDGQAFIEVAAPVIRDPDRGVLGAVLLRVHVAGLLLPRDRLTAGERGQEETFLVRSEGATGRVLALLSGTPPGEAVGQTEAGAETGLPIPADLKGLVETRDEKGDAIIAAFAPIEDSRWGSMMKVAARDLLPPSGVPNQAAALALLFLLAAGLAVAGFWWAGHQAALDGIREEEARRRAHLEAQHALLRRFGNDIVLLVAPDGAIIEANDRARAAYGYGAEELCQLNVRDLRSPGSPSDVEAEMRRAGSEAGGRFRSVHRRKDGSTFPVEVSSRPIEIGERRYVHSIIRDLSEEDAARQASDLQAKLLDTLHDAVIAVDVDLRVRTWNQAARRIYGWSAEEAIGRKIGEVSGTEYPDGEAGRVKVFQEVSGSGRVHVDLVQHRRDGSRIEVESEASALRGPDGAVSGYLLVNRDLTERRRAEQALRESEDLFRRLSERSLVGVYLIQDGRFGYVNPRMAEIFGYRPEDIAGRLGPLDLTCEQDRPAVVEHMRRRLEGEAESVHYEFVGEGKDGSRPFVEVFGTRTLWHGRPAIVGTLLDITLRKKAERALREGEDRLRRILETADEGIWVTDAEARTEFVNPRMAEILGVREEEVIGRPLLEVVPPELLAQSRADLEALRRGEKIRREGKVRRPDGSEAHLIESRSPIVLSDGRVAGTVAVYMDVTARRAAEERLLQAQKMEAVGRLASGVAHDFNNLLVVILSCANFLLEGTAETDERRSDLRDIKEAGERAAKLVRQLLAFGRHSAYTPVHTDLGSIVLGMEPLLRRTIGEDITVEVSTAAEPWPIYADPGQLEQVLMNLAVNARDAMSQGGRLRIETRNEGGGSAQPNRRAVLVVSDTGCGMTPEVRARIFEPFFTTKEQGKGTGLGLSTVFGIVEQAGGTISVESAPGRGATFEVSLPVESLKESGEAPASEVRPAGGQGVTVLVVEDEDAIRRVTVRMLREAGFHAVEAATPQEALLKVVEGKVDIVLTDVVMPHMSGAVLAKRIQELRSDIPVVFMSGYADRDVELPQGAVIVAKPFTKEALAGRLAGTLRAVGAGTRSTRRSPDSARQ
jgi:PAS domain S-box-containing protein